MSSSVFFKFKSQKEPSRVTFDGTGISVFELKREIITINRLGDGTDFDLAIYNEDTNEEYDDDTSIIPRSTSIIARRLPAAKAGRGGAARYVSGKMPVNARNASRIEAPASKLAVQATSQKPMNGLSEMNGAQTEEERIAAMFKAGADQWEQQQQEMANATPIHRSGPFKGKPLNVPDHKPPPGYICYRCGDKGHWIQACPTNNDPNFDGRPRVKRTTGIPRSFLKTIEKPAALSSDGTGDDSRQPSGVMVNAEGEFVVAEPDKASWEQYQAKAKVSAAAQEAAATGNKELQDRGLECPIDKRLFVEPTKTPCCGKTYCSECINNALIESDFVCPGCSTEGVLMDNLEPDNDMAKKVQDYEQEKVEQKKMKEASKSPPQKKESHLTEKAKSPSPAVSTSRASTSTPKPVANGNSKKRPAEEELKNEHVPKGPAATRNQEVQQPKESPLPVMGNFDQNQNPFNQLNGFPPPMPFNQQQQFGNQGFFPSQHIPQGGYPNNNGYMGMPSTMGPMMGMNPGMMNPMMQSGGYTGNNGGGWNQMGNMTGMGYAAPQQNGMYGGYNNMLPSGGYGQGSMQMPMGNMMMMPNGMGTGGFPNQQRTVFSEPFPNEEDDAYFRKPVNPHRHQARQRRVRPSDYREL
ncbi:MAG: hypothetical protein M1819_000993 [Sarea resinae]|nr:MAG: hypothetical protein M1819_000993 [Sarea resinae]